MWESRDEEGGTSALPLERGITQERITRCGHEDLDRISPIKKAPVPQFILHNTCGGTALMSNYFRATYVPYLTVHDKHHTEITYRHCSTLRARITGTNHICLEATAWRDSDAPTATHSDIARSPQSLDTHVFRSLISQFPHNHEHYMLQYFQGIPAH